MALVLNRRNGVYQLDDVALFWQYLKPVTPSTPLRERLDVG
jgi:hypothetical protein